MKHAVTTMALAVACAGVVGMAVAGSNSSEAPVVDEGKLGVAWSAAEGASVAAPGYPAAFAGRGDDVCLAIGYAVAPDGTTGDFTVLREWSSTAGEDAPAEYWDAFAQSGAQAISQWRFSPLPGVAPRRTYTVATMAFTGRGNPAQVRAHCHVDDLAHLLRERQSRYVMDYSREKRDLERNRRQAQAANIAAISAAASRRLEQGHQHPPQGN